MIAQNIGTIRYHLVASPSYLAQYGIPQTPTELNQYPCTTWASTAEISPSWQLGAQKHPINPHFACNDYHQLHHIALSGRTICELPDFLAQPYLEQGQLVSILTDYPLPSSPLHLVYPKHRHPSSLVRTYLQYSQQWLKRHRPTS